MRSLYRAMGSVLASAALVAVMAAPASATVTGRVERLFHDDFRAGFDTVNTWVVARDGIPTTSADGLNVRASGTNPATGEPAFVYTTPQEDDGGLGASDEVKWGATVNHTSSNGFRGFDVPAGSVFRCEVSLAVRTFGTAGHPFGNLAGDPDRDLRLASATVQSADPETGSVFTYFVTNQLIYAAYARQPKPGQNHASFFYAIPVTPRVPSQTNSLAIEFDKDAGVVSWVVDGRRVLRLDRIGEPAFDRKYLLTDHGGTPQLAQPRQLYCGFSTVTFLDGAGRDGRGLVRLSSLPDVYYAPRVGAPTPAEFYDDESLESNRLWGQGISIQVDHVSVTLRHGH
ncbi:DUF6081 family protein [Nonomuraea jabiensis]|uniref:Secreted protein n=1 Tax=Nonomuraea jabiensis TaxID=882448 RepID=A0A7W9GG53_9ACTN|nr:DUF6081 family protein [Nonomuraea jabiensis]MBB5783215.1 hypothetical protein [Nonomuraea jabiensis]